jgi:hypothetical protein
LDELQASLHEDLFNWGLETWPKLDGVIFIDLPVDVAQQRVAKRGRTAESAIPFDYQNALIEKHRQWLHGNCDERFAGPVLTLDGSGDKQDGAVRMMAKSVADFIDQIQATRKQKPSTNIAKRGCNSRDQENIAPRVVNNMQQHGDTGVAMPTTKVAVSWENAGTYLTPIKSQAHSAGACRQTPIKRAKSEPAV